MITFFDSNIFVHALDFSEPDKRLKAIARIEQGRTEGTVALSTQVLHEVYSICRRKLKPELPHDVAAKAVRHLCEFMMLGSNAVSVQSALTLVQQHQLGWGDALILEAAMRADADLLVSEDG